MRPKPLDPRSVCLAAVTYFPDASFFKRFSRLAKRFGGSIIVDNKSPADVLQSLKGLEDTDVILNEENRGLAYALNQAARRAIKQSFSWIFLLDQDSDMDDGVLEIYGKALASVEPADHVAVIGNNYSYAVDHHQVPLISQEKRKHPYIECQAVITAGSLVSLSLFKKIGPFREDFFIDWVDTEYCHRARRLGHKIVMVTKPLVRQTIGNTVERQSVVGSIRTTNHASRRRYYMARNLILLFKEFATFEPGWFVARFYEMMSTAFKILFFEQDKAAKLGSMMRGLYDGVTGK